ncbi:MAG: hypothetical protein ACI9EF_003018 [Pseudohongiellaceae bacterium]|jgi:hypothetical protein
MNKLFKTAVLMLVCSASAAAQVPEGDLSQLLPGSTMVFASVDELSKAVMLDEDGALMKLLQEEAVQDAFEDAFEFFGELDDDEFLLGLDLEEEELAKLFSGRAMVAIPEIILEESDVETNGSSTATVNLSLELGRGIVVMTDFDGTRDRFEELLENLTQFREDDELIHTSQVVHYEYDDVRLYNIEELDTEMEVDDSTWLALVDNLLLISDEEETLQDFADLARNGAPEGDRLSEDPRYLEALDMVGPHDALVYINLSELLPLVNQLIEHQVKKQGMMVAAFLRAEDLIAALGLDAIKSMFAGLYVEDDEAGFTFGFTHSDTELGLHTMLTHGDGGVEIPGYFSSDFHSASISRFDFSAAYAAFDKMLLKASPTGHNMLQGQIAMAEEGGLEVINGLLNNMDSHFVEVLGYPDSTVAGPDDQPTQAYVVRIKDPQSLHEALTLLGEELTTEDPVEFMNEQIQELPLPVSFPPGSDNSSMFYAVVGNSLVLSLGNIEMVENLISHIKNPGESLLDDDDLMDAFDALPGDDCVAIGFVDVASLLNNLRRAGDQAIELKMIMPPTDGGDLEGLLEAQEILDSLPDTAGIHYYIVSKTYQSYDAFVQRMLLRPNL